MYLNLRGVVFPLENLVAGDIIQIKPGENIPADGTVVDGTSEYIFESSDTYIPQTGSTAINLPDVF